LPLKYHLIETPNMKNTEARAVLGLEPGDNPRAFAAEFEETREYKQELVNNAPSEEIRERYQTDLIEYEAAMRAVVGKQGIRPNTDFIVVMLLIATLSVFGWWGYRWYQQQWRSHSKTEIELADLKTHGRAAVIARKWGEAEKAYGEIERLDPGSRTAAAGFESIKEGKLEEENQQIFYTLGESQAALEAGRWDEAEKLVQSALELSPENKAAKHKLGVIAKERRRQEVSLKMTHVSDTLNAGDLAAARQSLEELRSADPQNPNIPIFDTDVEGLERSLRKRHREADELYGKALKLDTGEFSQEAVALLEEARRLHPLSAKIKVLYEKMGAYSRAIKVPGDYPDIPAAILAARPNDIIRVSAGTYKTPLIITKPISLKGSADGKTIIELPAKEAGFITVSSTAPGTRISGFELRHTGFDHGLNRYSGITIEAQDVTISSCSIQDCAGHGIAVLGGAQAKISSCKISRCGWDGISVYGEDSRAEISDTLCQENLQHGIGFWLGGSGSVTKSKVLKNGLCGILAMSTGTKVTISSNTCSGNREAGILLSDAVSAEVISNTCEKNLLSGIVARSENTQVDLVGNTTKGNHEVGILTHQGVKVGKFENNSSMGNTSQQIWRDADLTSRNEN